MAIRFTTESINATTIEDSSGPLPFSNRVAIQRNQDETPHLDTTLVTTTIIDTVLSQITFTTPSSQTALTSIEALINAIESSMKPASPKASHQGHIGNVGTVVSEADVPKEWGPKFLDVERAQANKFMGYMVLIFAATMVGIIGIGWWK